MKKNLFKRLFSAALVAVMAIALCGAATATGADPITGCAQCEKNGLVFTGIHATNSWVKLTDSECARVYACNNGHSIMRMHNGSFVDATPHAFETKVVAPTCDADGYTLHTCKLCKFEYKDEIVGKLSHWYDVWNPVGDDKMSAPCKRTGCEHVKTTDCVKWDFTLNGEDYYVCPVCGETSDGTQLELVSETTTKPITGWTPEGDLVLRVGDLSNGEKIMSVGFEFDARLVLDTGSTDFTVPADVLDGYKLMLLDADGNETELEVTSKASGATFNLDFAALKWEDRIPVRILHLVPVAAEAAK